MKGQKRMILLKLQIVSFVVLFSYINASISDDINVIFPFFNAGLKKTAIYYNNLVGNKNIRVMWHITRMLEVHMRLRD